MKIWTENDMAPIIENLERETEAFARYGTNRTPFILRDTRAAISAGEQELDDLTICGFMIGDLVPLAAILRAKGVRPDEITDWRKDLQGLLDFVFEQEMEAHQKAVADVLKGLEGPDKETGEWFAATKAGWTLAKSDEELGCNELAWRNIFNPMREKNEE